MNLRDAVRGKRDLGMCKGMGGTCKARACGIAVIQWSGERIPVCGAHLAKLRRKLGSGVQLEREPAPPEAAP